MEQGYLAVGGDVDHYGVLGHAPVAHWSAIQRFRTIRWTPGDPAERRRLRRIGGCLDKLSASLLQISRLRAHHDELARLARELPSNARLAWQAAPALADFEGLLLQGRAALDRLTWFVAAEYRNQCSSYRRLASVLDNFRADSRAQAILGVLAEAADWLNALYAQLDAPESLRDLIGHRHAVSEGIQNCFSAVAVPPGRVLLLDCDIKLPGLEKPLPTFGSAHASARYLPFVLLGTLALFADMGPLKLDQCTPAWENLSVALSSFIEDEPAGSPRRDGALTYVTEMTPDGFELTTRNVSRNLYDHCISTANTTA